MECHPYTQRAKLTPGFALKFALCLNGGFQSVEGCSKSNLEGVTDHLVYITTLRSCSCAQDRFLSRERAGHPLRVIFPPLGTAFYICKKKGNGACRWLVSRHVSYIITIKKDSNTFICETHEQPKRIFCCRMDFVYTFCISFSMKKNRPAYSAGLFLVF